VRERNKIERYSFAKIPSVIDMPNLNEIQLSSFNNFLQMDVPPSKRRDQGLQAVFKSIFPITDAHNTMSLEFVEYSNGVPKYSKDECIERDMT
jgi:DNA-directed RNA polymerase subunit beta